MITTVFRPEGTGVAGHIQPRIEIRWENGDSAPCPEGWGSDDPFRPEESVRYSFSEEVRDLGGFYQCSESFQGRTWSSGDPIEGGFSVLVPSMLIYHMLAQPVAPNGQEIN